MNFHDSLHQYVNRSISVGDIQMMVEEVANNPERAVESFAYYLYQNVLSRNFTKELESAGMHVERLYDQAERNNATAKFEEFSARAQTLVMDFVMARQVEEQKF